MVCRVPFEFTSDVHLTPAVDKALSLSDLLSLSLFLLAFSLPYLAYRTLTSDSCWIVYAKLLVQMMNKMIQFVSLWG